MKKIINPELEKWRLREGPMATTDESGYNGVFIVPIEGTEPFNISLVCIVSDGTHPISEGWEHVSTQVLYDDPEGNRQSRVPFWSEMCMVKDMFWNEDETVVQFHPRKSEYVNNAENVLHLWRNRNEETKLPPIELV